LRFTNPLKGAHQHVQYVYNTLTKTEEKNANTDLTEPSLGQFTANHMTDTEQKKGA